MILSEMTTMRKLMLLHGVVGGKAVEDFASGNPCVFTTDLAKPLRRLALTLLPKQSGTGDPSPENIRPLIPWGEVGTWHGGKNLFDKSAVDTENGFVANRYIDNTGTENASNNFNVSEYIPVIPGSYVLSGLTGGGPSICFYGKDKAFLSGMNYAGFETRRATAPEGTAFCRISIPKANVDSLQFEVGNTATAYTPYSPITPHPVNLTGIIPPVYGCSVDLTTGEVWGTWASVDMGTLNWQTSADRFAVWVKLTPNPETKDGWGVDDPMACCSKYRYGNVRENGGEDKAIGFYNGLLYARDTSYETPEAFKTAVSGLLLVYRLETPVLLATLTPQQINALVGVNTVWSDADGVEVTYLKKG